MITWFIDPDDFSSQFAEIQRLEEWFLEQNLAANIDKNPTYHINKHYQCPFRSVRGASSVSLKQLKDSASQGCAACIVHYNAVIQHFALSVTPQTQVRRYHRDVFTFLQVSGPGDEGKDRFIRFFIDQTFIPNVPTSHRERDQFQLMRKFRFNGAMMTRPQVLRVPPGNPLSSSSLETVRSWLTICTSKHSQCGQGQPKRLPTRILDISGSTIRLHHSQDETARYACLSHCWGTGGGSKLLKATRDTLQDLQVEIPWTRLPRTFQDAINFARELGLSYIWIDSLCIVQDNNDDWQREASRMASIYQNAFITLAGTSSGAPDEGLFHSGTSPNTPKPTPATLYFNGRTSQVLSSPPLPHIRDFTTSASASSSTCFPLLSRAWVYQERILSPRFLHFTSSELYWECRSHEFCECGEYSQRLTLGSKAEFALKGVTNAWHRPSPWYMLVSEFSALSMTFGRDVFPAMSGLAKAWSGDEGDEYCAGLWRSSFIEGLFWQRNPAHVDGRVAERPAEWRAPSWSWAAITGAPVTYSVEGVFKKGLVDVLEVECVAKGSDPQGELRSAFAVLEGKALMGRVSGKTTGSGSELRAFIELTWDGGSYTLPLQPDVAFWDDETTSENASLNVLILMLAERPGDDMKQEEASRAFLVLQSSHGVTNSWSRIAALRIDFHFSIAKEAYEMAGRDPWELVYDIRIPKNVALRRAHSALTQRVFDEFDRQAERPVRIV